MPEIGIDGQQRLLDANVLLLGLGGLGSPVAMYLAAAGIGRLTLVDFDQVDLSNLQRQIIHQTDSIGQPKVLSARDTLAGLNPDCQVTPINRQPDDQELASLVQTHDLVVDATDNFTTRFQINRLCVTSGTPLVSGAAIRWEGQVSVFDNQPDSACYNCLYAADGNEDLTCTANGVLAPVVGVIGSLQAIEAIKLLTGVGQTLQGRLLVLDALSMQWRSLNIRRDPNCPTCGGND